MRSLERSDMGRGVWIGTVTVLLIAGSSQAALAEPGGGGRFSAGFEDGNVDVSGDADGPGDPGSGGVAGVSGPSYQTRHIPGCEGNDPAREGADAGCFEADAACPGVAVRYWLYRRLAETAPDGPWEMAGVVCLEPAEASAEAVLPAFTLADFQRLPLPAGTPNIEPSNGYTLVGVPTNVYASAEPVTLDTELLGFPVQVRATPSRYS